MSNILEKLDKKVTTVNNKNNNYANNCVKIAQHCFLESA